MPIFKAPNGDTFRLDSYEQQDVLPPDCVEISEEDLVKVLQSRKLVGSQQSLVPVSPRQIRQALTRSNLRTAVESAIASGDQDTKDWWEFATQFERQHPMVVAMGKALNQTDAQLDQLWQLAATL